MLFIYRHRVQLIHGHSSSAVCDHLGTCNLCKSNFSIDCFKVLERGNNDLETTIKEALQIKYNKPSLNKKLFTQGTSFVLKIF